MAELKDVRSLALRLNFVRNSLTELLIILSPLDDKACSVDAITKGKEGANVERLLYIVLILLLSGSAKTLDLTCNFMSIFK